jgi:hypothetical protein
MVATRYTVRHIEFTDEDNILDLLRASLGEGSSGGRQKNFWRWKHQSSPFGPSYVRVAHDEAGTLVGLRAFMRWEFKVEGRVIRAVRAVDTATHPSYQRMAIFSTLTKEVVADVESDGVDLIFNTPNQYSLLGYLKLDWHHVATIQPLIKVLNYPRFTLGMARSRLSKPMPQCHVSAQFFRAEPTPVITILEQRSVLEKLLQQDQQWWDQQEGIRTRRSWDYLWWRYGSHPTIPYWAVVIGDGDELQGCAIFRTNTRYGLKEVVLCELILAEPEKQLGRRLLDQFRSLLRADYLITYFPQGIVHRQALEAEGFRTVPRRGMDFISRPLVSDLPQDPRLFSSWRLIMGDLELF